ncbi:AraC family transcriptional regulator [Nannocystis radixulma]|uniref:AraC family transcriptional regulator n=1 Tax=Nannocystis radixulma TaxID=2995305 RepID=A0ABT5BET4_9BACT|nr:AraC family transcriptional regulator [Nannocystis radixulma]MDC0672582.1 AraC family transcriptional regulator [Nannocystis radixulma]
MTESDKAAELPRPAPEFDVPLNTAVCPPLVGAALAGVDVEALLADVGIDREAADDADLTLAPALRAALWRESLQRSRDPALALHAAEAIPFGQFDVVDYVASEAPTLGEGIAALARYFRIVRADFRLRFEEDDDEGRLWLDLPPSFGLVVSYTTEFTLACILIRFRWVVGQHFAPTEASFCYPAPGHLAEYERVFACPLRFDADETMVRFPRAVLALPQPRADARLRLVLERAAAAVLARLPPASELTQQLRQALSEELRGGVPTCEQVARRLAIGVRTLNRRLQSEGTSFQQQLAELRCELARGYLADRRMSISEVAYLLGFSEPSAFHRAFKRWTGHSPQSWRTRAA